MENKFKLDKEKIQTLIEHAGMAPSGGNIQPWKVLVEGETIRIKLDPQRSNNFLDIGYYASFFALGTFTENLCITANELGLKYNIFFPKFTDISSTIVEIVFSGKRSETNLEEKILFE